MFNYTRNDQINKKPVSKSIPTPIEIEVSMPAGMQPVPPPIVEVQPSGICIYPTMPIMPSTPPVAPPMPPSVPMQPVVPPTPPSTPMQPVLPPVQPITPVQPILPPVQPIMQCLVCGNMGMHPNCPCQMCGNIGMQPIMPCPMWENKEMQPAMPYQVWENTEMQPPMPYQMWEDMSEQMPMADAAQCHNDIEVAYVKKMYPPVCQKIQKYIDSELSQYDHDLSPIYEMYPAAETVDYMANCIYTNMKGDLPNVIKEYECNRNMRAPIGGSFYTLVYALLLNELYRKRMRRHFYPTYSTPFYNY